MIGAGYCILRLLDTVLHVEQLAMRVLLTLRTHCLPLSFDLNSMWVLWEWNDGWKDAIGPRKRRTKYNVVTPPPALLSPVQRGNVEVTSSLVAMIYRSGTAFYPECCKGLIFPSHLFLWHSSWRHIIDWAAMKPSSSHHQQIQQRHPHTPLPSFNLPFRPLNKYSTKLHVWLCHGIPIKTPCNPVFCLFQDLEGTLPFLSFSFYSYCPLKECISA